MTTRIYHRFDTSTNWTTAAGANAGKLAKGEIGIVKEVSENTTSAIGYLGINETPTLYSSCPVVFNGFVDSGAAEPVFSEPVVYETPGANPATGSTLSWDSANSKWIVEDKVLNLDAYPTSDGVVVWNQSLGKFQVGAAVSAVELDGGDYTV